MASADFLAPLDRDFKGSRIGWLGDLGGHLATEPGLLEVCEAALDSFRDVGCDVDAVPVLCMASDTFADPASRVGGTVVVNASGVAAWVLGRPVVLSADRVARLAQLMETSV